LDERQPTPNLVHLGLQLIEVGLCSRAGGAFGFERFDQRFQTSKAGDEFVSFCLGAQGGESLAGALLISDLQTHVISCYTAPDGV
jgi:hypothetical protein